MVTSRDVARLAGVSQSTVSFVMSGRRDRTAETFTPPVRQPLAGTQGCLAPCEEDPVPAVEPRERAHPFDR
ncbi:LacI family DNA-binding transcriptional regulator [Streptomyces sp. RTd22]|uniref:LacI family DNA-binding transcriptional regulator n=1 Tax=Streptomyces sp. RTd22 TaxID=1841249 RepID=UPI0009A02F59